MIFKTKKQSKTQQNKTKQNNQVPLTSQRKVLIKDGLDILNWHSGYPPNTFLNPPLEEPINQFSVSSSQQISL